MTRTLKMQFRNEAAKEVNIMLANPKAGITKAEVLATMALIVAKNLFTSAGGNLISAGEATILIQDTGVLA